MTTNRPIVLITGSNGLVAQQLLPYLSHYTVRYLTRKKNKENEYEWNVEQGTIDLKAFIGVQHIIHLAGANIAEKRWTETRKQEIISSRIDSINLISKALNETQTQLETFISASATGYYGTQTTQTVYTENSAKGNDFLSDVVFQWEQASQSLLEKQLAKRVVILRSGVILSKKGGAFEKIRKPIQYYLGAVLGSGNQYMPWIHIADICSMYLFVLQDTNTQGVYNATAPESVTNKQFTQQLAHVLQKPLILPPVPAFVLRLIFGQASAILLQGSAVSSSKIQSEGFEFKYPNLSEAFRNLVQ